MSNPTAQAELQQMINDPFLQHDFCAGFLGENLAIHYLQNQISMGEGDLLQDFIDWLKN